MSVVERLRETVSTDISDSATIDGTHYEDFLPLTYGDARALLALVDLCQQLTAPVVIKPCCRVDAELRAAIAALTDAS